MRISLHSPSVAGLFPFAVFITLGLAACQPPEAPPKQTGSAGSDTPPFDAAESVVEADDGEIAAQFLSLPSAIEAGREVVLQVENQGEVAIRYGRPITVEYWNGTAWAETDESRQTMWTMEMLQVPPGERGVEQRWPFNDAQQPEAGWYRFTKYVQADSDTAPASPLLLRARAEVTN